MRISDWSSDVCSSDLNIPWSYPFGIDGFMTVASGDLIGGGMDDVEKGVEALWHDWRRDPARKYPQCIKPQLYTKRSEEHTSELQSLMRISYAVFCLKQKKINQ